MARINHEISNYKEVYDDVEQRQQSRRFVLGMAATWNALYRPHTSALPGAYESLEEAWAKGKKGIYILNHVLGHDPNVDIAAVSKVPLLRSRIGNISVLAKATLWSGGSLNPVPWLMDQVGGIGVYRQKDHEGEDPALLREAGDHMLETSARMIFNGGDLAGFPEGTCNDNPEKLKTFNTGMAYIGHRVRAMEIEEDPESEQGFFFLPMATSYGVEPFPESLWGRFQRARHASFVVGHPIETIEEKPFQTMRVIKAGMTATLAAAHADYYERRGYEVPLGKGLGQAAA